MHIRCDPLERDIVRISTDMFLQFRSFEENIDLKIFIHNFLRKFVIYYTRKPVGFSRCLRDRQILKGRIICQRPG